MFKNAVWIGPSMEDYRESGIAQGDANGRFVYYRLDFEGLLEGAATDIQISASTRYRLWVNGEPIGSGPCRGDRFRQFVDRRTLSGCFRNGKNNICVQVLLCDFNAIETFGSDRMPLISAANVPAGHRLALEGEFRDANGNIIPLTTGQADWRIFMDASFALLNDHPVNDNMGAMTERIDFRMSCPDWKQKEFDASGWKPARSIEPAARSQFMKSVGFLPPLLCEDRTIPLLFERDEQLLKNESSSKFPLHVPASTALDVTLDLKAHANFYPAWNLMGGKDARVSFIYFERYMEPDAVAGKVPDTNKVKRDDAVNGVIPPSVTDTITLPGGSLCYEPFWVRTARFVKLHIETADDALTLDMPRLRQTGYPLNPEAEIRSTEAWVADLYEICKRTLQNSMLDVYTDCPYYEQMQYPMDTRLQAVFTYAISRDTALAKKALEDFHSSMTPYGFIQGRAPSGYTQIISNFSFFYIRMLKEFWERTGDTEVLRRYYPDCVTILNAFERYRDADTGLLLATPFWDFVDWQPAWKHSVGRPAALLEGPSAYTSLLLANAMEDTAIICDLLDLNAEAVRYRKEKANLLNQIRTACYDPEREMLREGPSFSQFSQGTQSWAVLAGLFKGEEAKNALRHTIEDDDVLQCTFSASFDFFRACEKSGCYELTAKQFSRWKNLLNEHCTTVPETPTDSRSECHGWSALPIYELFRVLAGIRQIPGKPEQYTMHPELFALTDLEGCIPVPGGKLKFSIHKTKDGLDIQTEAPEGVDVHVIR